MTVITSEQNPTVKHAHTLLTHHRTRKKTGQTVLEGVHLIEAYLNQNLLPKYVLVGETSHHHPEVAALLAHIPAKNTLVLCDSLYKKIRTLGCGIDIMAIIDTPKHLPTDIKDIRGDCLILDKLQDLGNIGTLLRTASAVGIFDVITTPKSASLWSPKCLRAGMGAHFALRIFEQVEICDIIRHIKTPFYATSSHTNQVIYHQDLTCPIAWVMGHEGQGVCDALMQKATPIALPQPNGQESLNVAVAGSICFYEMLRQRKFC